MSMLASKVVILKIQTIHPRGFYENRWICWETLEVSSAGSVLWIFIAKDRCRNLILSFNSCSLTFHPNRIPRRVFVISLVSLLARDIRLTLSSGTHRFQSIQEESANVGWIDLADKLWVMALPLVGVASVTGRGREKLGYLLVHR